jgi:hypothetical protein
MANPPEDGFLSRWSRRKREEHPEEAPAEPSTEAVETTGVESPTETHEGDADEGDPEVIARLPDIDSMDDSSDFKVFLQTGVPEALRRRALRKLWGVNPVLANLDGLNDYDEDYTQIGVLGQTVKSLYQVGKGFVTDEEVAPAEAETEPDVADDAETETAGIQGLTETESQTAALDESSGRIESPVGETVEKVRNPKGTALGRRWGTPEKPS